MLTLVETFIQLITFLYTDNCDVNLCSARELLIAANEYGLDRLQSLAAGVL